MNKVKKYYTIWTIIVILIFSLLTVMGFIYRTKTTGFEALEEQLIESAKKYVDSSFLYPESSETTKITFKEMYEAGYIEELKKDKQICDGYVLISSHGSAFKYEGFVKCGNYQTRGFSN